MSKKVKEDMTPRQRARDSRDPRFQRSAFCASCYRNFRSTGSLHLHVVLEHDGYWSAADEVVIQELP